MAASKTNGIGGGIKMAARPEKEKAKYIEKIKIICVGHTEGEHTLPGVAGKYYASRITFLLKHRNNL